MKQIKCGNNYLVLKLRSASWSAIDLAQVNFNHHLVGNKGRSTCGTESYLYLYVGLAAFIDFGYLF